MNKIAYLCGYLQAIKVAQAGSGAMARAGTKMSEPPKTLQMPSGGRVTLPEADAAKVQGRAPQTTPDQAATRARTTVNAASRSSYARKSTAMHDAARKRMGSLLRPGHMSGMQGGGNIRRIR